MRAFLGASALLIMLSACVYRDDEPEQRPVTHFVAAPLPPPVAVVQRPLPPVQELSGPILSDSIPGTVTVAPGESLGKIAKAHNIPPRAIIDENKLQPPYGLEIGQVLVIPAVRRYIVQPGDSIEEVSKRFNVDIATVAQRNHLHAPYDLKTGFRLILPPIEEKRVAAVPVRPVPPVTRPALSPPAAAPLPVAAALPAPDSSTPAPSVDHPQPVAAQIIQAPPAKAPTPVIAAPPAAPPAQVAASVPEKPSAPPPDDKPDTDTDPVVDQPAVTASVAAHRAPVAPLFTWPVRGKIVSAFGPLANGTHNDGLNIEAPEGTEVDAADSGTVVYAGNALRGFGNLLLIKHDGGWVTAYGHNSALLVKLGDHVKRGQAVAKVGSTGRVSGPQLHFEVRRSVDNENKAFDPLDHLPAMGQN